MLPLLYPHKNTKPSFMASLTNRSTFLQPPTFNTTKQPLSVVPTHCFYLTRSQFNWPHTTTSPLAQLKKLNLSYRQKPQRRIAYTSLDNEAVSVQYMTLFPSVTHCLTDMVLQVTIVNAHTGHIVIEYYPITTLMLLFDGSVYSIQCHINLIHISLFATTTTTTSNSHQRLLLHTSPQQSQPLALQQKKIEYHHLPFAMLDPHSTTTLTNATPWSYSPLEFMDEDEEESLYSCSSYSIIYSDDEYQDNNDDDYYSLSQLVQDTLNYIQSNGGAYTDELNLLVPKLTDYLTSSC